MLLTSLDGADAVHLPTIAPPPGTPPAAGSTDAASVDSVEDVVCEIANGGIAASARIRSNCITERKDLR
jgi:hypothetical protein